MQWFEEVAEYLEPETVYTHKELVDFIKTHYPYEALQLQTIYNDCFQRMCVYGFIEGTDYAPIMTNRSDGKAGKPRTVHQHTITSMDLLRI